jgi:hypothetical protein
MLMLAFLNNSSDTEQEFADCGENCSRAYYPPERDSNDHYASNALRVLEPLIGTDYRDELSAAYREDKEELSLYELRKEELTINDRFALVALRVALPALHELVDAGMGKKE